MLPLQAVRYDICIDPGHCGDAEGGADGVNGPTEPNESDFNLDIALVCEADLNNYGYSVILTRHDEHYLPRLRPWHKAYIANGIRRNDLGQKTDFAVSRAVSIHNNSSTNPNAHGTETYYSFGKQGSLILANYVHNGAWNYLQMFPYAQNRGIKEAGFSFIKNCWMPACLIEVAFVSHSPPGGQWEQLLYNSGGIKDYAAYGIDDGIVNSLPGLHLAPTFLRPIFGAYYRGSVSLVWHPVPTTGVTYSVYRREHPNPDFILIASGISDTTYTDNTTTNDKTYSYYTIAVSGSQTSPRSIILTIRTPLFVSDYGVATGLNNGKKVVFDNNGIIHLTYSSDTSFWYTRSTDYGNIWSVSQLVESGLFASITIDGSNNRHIVGCGCPGQPDTASGEDTSYVIFYAQYRDSIWKNPSLYEIYDSILSVSFAIDPLDTGWVVFNTYDAEGYNDLKIGKFYTQTMPESLENVLTLDTYTGYGIGAIGVKVSDRSLHIVYEKNGTIMYLKRDNLGNWSTPFQVWVGKNPSLSVAGDLIHLIWESWYPTYTKIQTCYTNGKVWSRIQDITTNYDRGCFPYMEKGSIAVWQQRIEKQWEVYASQRDEFGGWTAPQNISQTSADSKYPQAAVYQTITQTRYVYLWTEGNASPYEVKILPVSSFRSNPIPLYAFDLGEKELSVFTEQRTGYLIYGSGFEKSVDYDTVCLKYRIAGLDPNKIYLLGLVFYQDEFNGVWKQRVLIDNSLIKTVDLPRRKLMIERFFIDSGLYSDGVVELAIDNQSFPKAVLSGFVVFEFSKENRETSSLTESRKDITGGFSIHAMPNPAKGNIQINYQLPVSGEIKLKIFSATGQIIRLISDQRPVGSYSLLWDGRDNQGRIVPNGVYFVRLESGDKVKSDKIILLH
ncbi:MAG: N-acetylmuramoyl-L-alanine amidase [candidate division WOR-3 bacterium]